LACSADQLPPHHGRFHARAAGGGKRQRNDEHERNPIVQPPCGHYLAVWRSVKYEEVYLRAYDSVSEARASIGRYLNFYNGRRPHTSLDGMTPDRAYLNPLLLPVAAA